jgi:murein DD-endopeptidase MepM/ murein hydrolase activator NlpD
MRETNLLLLGGAVGAGLYLLRPKRSDAHAARGGVAATAATLVLDFARPVPPQVRAIVSSGWSRHRDHGPHRALDIPLREGTEILAIADGEVTRARWDEHPQAGLRVTVTHSAGLVSRYLHLSQPLVEVGQRVRRGDVVALSGNTGNSSGPHLHLDIRAPRALLADLSRALGMPRPGWGSAMAGTYSIPGEPLVPVDDYRNDVRDEARRAGVSLYRGPITVPLGGGHA